jgi:hypothetical protein
MSRYQKLIHKNEINSTVLKCVLERNNATSAGIKLLSLMHTTFYVCGLDSRSMREVAGGGSPLRAVSEIMSF